jgi:hypothetical protein
MPRRLEATSLRSCARPSVCAYTPNAVSREAGASGLLSSDSLRSFSAHWIELGIIGFTFAFCGEIVVKYRLYIGVLPGKGPGC